MNKKEIGKNIKCIRQLKGMSREDIVNKIDISIHTLAKYEQGQREPNIEMLNKIASALGISINDLIGTGFDLTNAKKEEVSFLYGEEITILRDIFSLCGYTLEEGSTFINVIKDNKLIVSVPEKDFTELAEKMVNNIKEFSDFQINKLLETYTFLN